MFGLFVIDTGEPLIEKLRKFFPIQTKILPNKTGIDESRLQMRKIDRRSFREIKQQKKKIMISSTWFYYSKLFGANQ